MKKDFEKNSLLVRGIGIDIEDVSRFRNCAPSGNPQFYKKIFTHGEMAYCMAKTDPYPHFTARFAAKEAVAKAVGMTIFELKNIEITNKQAGRPAVAIRSRPGQRVEVSLSHTKRHGAAIALWLH